MAQQASLEIVVDTAVQLDSGSAPRQMLSALRRRLRQSDAGAGRGGAQAAGQLPTLMETKDGQHRLPQGLLPWVTETCQRKEIPYEVVDRRSVIACRALRSSRRLGQAERDALRRLMLRDSGVVIAPGGGAALAVELLARRQQRSLIIAGSDAELGRWLELLRSSLGLGAPHVAALTQASSDSRVVVGSYRLVEQRPPAVLRDEFGMVVFDALSTADPVLLARTIRRTGARYLLGLATAPTRQDGHHHHLLLSLGGVQCQLEDDGPAPLPPVVRTRVTEFCGPFEGRDSFQALVSAMVADPDRCALVAADVAAEAAAGHRCLVLSERRVHLEHLARRLPDELRVETLTSAVGLARRTAAIQRFERGEAQVLLSTGQIAQESVRTSCFDRLLLTFPFNYLPKLEQPLRALLRPHTGQRDAVLLDYLDAQVPPFCRAHERRQRYLARLRREVEQATARRRQMTLPL